MKILGPHASLCVHTSGVPLLHLQCTDVYTTRPKNDHYIYYNAVTVAILKWVYDINNYQRMFARQERGPGGVQTD